MGDTITTFGCYGCRDRLETIASKWSDSQSLVEQARLNGLTYTRGNDEKAEVSAGESCGNDFKAPEFRSRSTCRFTGLLQTLRTLAENQDLIYTTPHTR